MAVHDADLRRDSLGSHAAGRPVRDLLPPAVVTEDVCWGCGGRLTIQATQVRLSAEATHEHHISCSHSEPTCAAWRTGSVDVMVWRNDQGREEQMSVIHGA